jgi:cytochrome c-type biogenesis protein CcmE
MKPRFIIGIGVILAAVLAIIGFTIAGNSSLEVKVNELLAKKASGQDLSQKAFKLTGFVVGDSISYDPKSLHLEFDIVTSRDELVTSVKTAPRMRIVYTGAKPDTLDNEAQAIVTGKLSNDGKFYAGNSPDALLLQCPTKYESQKTASN